jgi:hypothetical protein
MSVLRISDIAYRNLRELSRIDERPMQTELDAAVEV